MMATDLHYHVTAKASREYRLKLDTGILYCSDCQEMGRHRLIVKGIQLCGPCSEKRQLTEACTEAH